MRQTTCQRSKMCNQTANVLIVSGNAAVVTIGTLDQYETFTKRWPTFIETRLLGGLVETPEEYVWSSARAWETGGGEPIAIDRDTVPSLTILDDHVDSKLMR